MIFYCLTGDIFNKWLEEYEYEAEKLRNKRKYGTVLVYKVLEKRYNYTVASRHERSYVDLYFKSEKHLTKFLLTYK